MGTTTTTLFKYIQSELIKRGLNEFEKDGELILFDSKQQFMNKIFTYDDDVASIMNDLFIQQSLNDLENDHHFKRLFLYRFVNRQINRQTIESFQLELANVFLSQADYINRIYEELEQYLTGASQSNQSTKQVNDGQTTTDSRSAFSDLPQSSTNLDVDNTIMTAASDNTVSRNKQTNQQASDGTQSTHSKNYQLDQLLKTSGIMEQILNQFDRKCFLQIY